MLGNMLWRGLPRRIMTSGGRAAMPARTVQPENEFKFPAIPAVDTAETQGMAMTALSDPYCISQV